MGRNTSSIELTNADREYLQLQTRTRTIQAQTVNRARIILLKADGISIDEIADKVGMNRKSVMLCLKKYKEGGIENALFDAPGEAEMPRLRMRKKHGLSVLPVRSLLILDIRLKHGHMQN